MGYLLLAVVFYAVVKFGFEVWSQLRYEKSEVDRDYGYEREIRQLKNRVKALEGNDVCTEPRTSL